MITKIYQLLAQKLDARLRCLEKGNTEWFAHHEVAILDIMRDTAPSGSGIDNGTSIDLDRSTGDRLVFELDYHHMNQDGYYDGWTAHTLTVKPSLMFGIDLRITGRDRNDIKDYLYDVYRDWLTTEVEDTIDGVKIVKAVTP